MEITAAVTSAARAPFSLERLRMDPPRDDEILVRIAGVGVCHTDAVARDQILPTRLPVVLGHEGAGRVVAVGAAVRKVAVGDAVVLTFQSCGHCPQCATRQPAYCASGPGLNYRGLRADGSTALHRGETPIGGAFFGQSSFASHALATERNVVRVPEDLPLALLGPFGCALQTGAGAVLRALDCAPGSSLLITGAGAVGLSAVMGAALRGCRHIVVSDPVAARRELALELGATAVIDPGAGSTLKQARALLRAGFDYSLDATGISPVMDDAIRALRPRGHFGLAAVPKNPRAPTPVLAAEILTFGYRITGIIEGDSDPDTFIPELLEHARAGRFPFEKLITTYPFAAINEAFADQAAGRTIKPVLLLPEP